ncbi:MAG: hypothetical protein GX465_11240 [Acidobacteria bacterium]|nr:hypothetical protein [Acidobacteriota bacterium]
MAEILVPIVRSAAVLAVLTVFYRLALGRDANFALNRAFLVGAAVLSLGLPLVRITSPFVTTVVPAEALAALPAATPVPAPSPGPGPLDVLFAAYIAGAAVALGLFLARIARLALAAARCGCERHRGLRIVLCGHSGEPFSFFRFVFVDRSRGASADLDRVLAHELAHVRQLHSLDVVLAEVLSVVQWFNPFVWPYKRSLRETHEYLADRAVIAQGCPLARYQLLIVEQSVGGRLLELASSFRTSQIKRRIAMLTKPQTKGWGRWKPLFLLPLAVVLVLAFAESRTVVQPGPGPALASAQDDAGKPAQTSEEELDKALKDKVAQLGEMKKKNDEMTAKLKDKLAATTDEAVRAKIVEALKDEQLKALEIGLKERSLQMKKVEWEMNKAGDPAAKADLEKKLAQLKATEEGQRARLIEIEKVRKALAQAEDGAAKLELQHRLQELLSETAGIPKKSAEPTGQKAKQAAEKK